jgi:hypothetical protein
LEVKSKALRNTADLLKAADEQVTKLQSIVADQKNKTEQLLVRTDNSEENQLSKAL